MQALPRGTVTFLFTDIEGSTRLRHDHPDQMPGAYARHDAILREAAADEGGRVYKTVGDAVQIAFPTAVGATIAALRAQQALQAEPWAMAEPLQVRMALHTGAVDPDAAGDYRSPALNRLGRLLSAGHGGQVLVSQATMELARDHLPAGASFRDLGEQRLKDLFRPERAYQLEGPDLQLTFPPLLTLDSHPNNLPTQLTQFIGRQDDVTAVRDLLVHGDTRLITLTGPGGIGKTRLSLQVAADVLEAFEDGTFVVQLDTLTDPTLVPAMIARAFGLREDSDVPITTSLITYLRSRNLLLVLDNLEQVIEAADFVGEILVRCPRVSVLATSRVRLQISGEQEFSVEPLTLPRPANAEDMATVSQYESVRLFVERARLVKPDFTVTNENVPAIAGICIRLDGLPLAIELAAARTRMLPPEAMFRRLTARLPLLTGGARNLPLRQQTLRGAIAWSYELLGEANRALFRRLAVFAGGATMEAIEAVAVDDEEFGEIFDGLERLVDHSLIRQTETAGEPRFSMFETIREFGLEELRTHGEAHEAHQRHARFYSQIASVFRADLGLHDMAAWLDRMEIERDNFRAAASWSLDNDVPTAWRMIGRGANLWSTRGPLEEGKSWLERVLQTSRHGVPLEDVAQALRASIPFANHKEDLAVYIRRIRQAHDLYLKTGKLPEAAGTLAIESVLVFWTGDEEQALQVNERGLELARASGDPHAVALCLNNLGYLYFGHGNFDAATPLFAELLGIIEDRDFHQGAYYLNSIADLYRDLGRLDESEALYQQSLESALVCQWLLLMSFNLMGLVQIAVRRGRWERAAILAGGEVMLTQGRDLGIENDPDMVNIDSAYHGVLLQAHKELGQDAYRAAWARGAAMSLEELVAEAARNTREAVP